MGDPTRSAAAPSRRSLLTGRAPRQPPPPALRNLYGLLPDDLPTATGDPASTARLDAIQAGSAADFDAWRDQLLARISGAVPDVVKRGAAGAYQGAKDLVSGAFTPTPEIETLRDRLKGLTAEQGDPIAGPITNFGIDQAVDATTPGDAAMNLLPEAKAAGAAGQLAAALPLQGRGTLAGALKYAGEGRYAVREPIIHRLEQLYEHGLSIPRSNWEGSQMADLLTGFGGDAEMAHRWARLWGATSPNTSAPVNTRESLSSLAQHLRIPSRLWTPEEARRFPGAKITMAPSKVPNINNAIMGLPLSGDKVEAMAGFMTGRPRVPIDVHALWALGSARTKLDDELAALRAFMSGAEGRPSRGGARYGALSKTDLYLRSEQAIADALRRIDSSRGQNPVFADLWEGTRAAKGLKPQGGPVDVLRAKGLLEREAMLDPDRLWEALVREGKWTAPAVR